MEKICSISELQLMISSLNLRLTELELRGHSYYLHGHTRTLSDNSSINSGDTAWMLVSSAMLILITIPGLGLFYMGLNRTINPMKTIKRIISTVSVVTILWICVGYSKAYGPVTDGDNEK